MTDKKTVLFVHQNFPAQYKHIAQALAQDNSYDVHCLAQIELNQDPKIKNHIYKITGSSSNSINEWAIEFETKMIRADAASKKANEMRDNGFSPDLIMLHPGWGEGFFLKELWPEAKIISYAEFYYKTSNCDIDFDKAFIEDVLKKDFKEHHEYNKYKLTARNAVFTHSYLNSDYIVCPTAFQKNVLPKLIQKTTNVIHDGIDTDFLKPLDDIEIKIRNKRLSKKDKIVTYVSRALDPYRGFHIFMETLPAILKNNPDAYVIIVGDETKTGYGAPHPDGIRYKDYYFSKIKDKIDMKRVFFVGRVSYDIFMKIIQISTTHIYLTYPFVLSWSMLEAMSCGALVIGSNTGPVTEVIKHNKNGLIVNFFDKGQIVETVTKVLENTNNFNRLRLNARKTIIDKYDLKTVCLPKHISLIEEALK